MNKQRQQLLSFLASLLHLPNSGASEESLDAVALWRVNRPPIPPATRLALLLLLATLSTKLPAMDRMPSTTPPIPLGGVLPAPKGVELPPVAAADAPPGLGAAPPA